MTTERNDHLTLADVMTEAPEHVHPDTVIREAARLMRDKDVGALPVVSDGQLVGIITDRDIVVTAVADGVDVKDAVIGPFVSTDLVSATPDMTVREAADLMASNQVRRLTVVEKGKLVGIVSMQDLAQAVGPAVAGYTETGITEE